MAINYMPDDELFSSWQPHLDEQSMDSLLKACEDPPDVFELPTYQALDEIFQTKSDTSIHAGDGSHTEEDIMFSIEEFICEGDYKQTETRVSEAPEEDGVNMDPRNEEPPTGENEENATGDDGTLGVDTPSSETVYCCCCNEIADMKR